MDETPKIISKENSSNEELSFGIAKQLREKTSVYVPIEVQVMQDYLVEHPNQVGEKNEDDWAEKYSPAFEVAFLHVVQGIVSKTNNSSDSSDIEKLGQDFLSQKKEIAHMIEDELYKKAA